MKCNRNHYISVWLRDASGAKTVPRNYANKNRTAKPNENMQILNKT